MQLGVKRLKERLEFAIARAKTDQSELARAVKVTPQAIQSLVSGRAKGSKHLLEIAQKLGVDYYWLKDGSGPVPSELSTNAVRISSHSREAPSAIWANAVTRVPVVGAVQAGVWREAIEWPQDDQYEIPVPIPAPYQKLAVSALEVHGASMDKVYKHGTVLLVVKFIDLGREPSDRERVIVQRIKSGQIEASVKEIRRDTDGIVRLWPQSNHPDFQAPLRLDPPAEDEEIVVSHKVIGSINFEA